MMTPTEKFIFNSFIFLFFSMILIAASLYLPQHINFLLNRAWFYWHGDDTTSNELTNAAIKSTGSAVAGFAKETMGFVGNVREGVGAASGRAEL